MVLFDEVERERERIQRRVLVLKTVQAGGRGTWGWQFREAEGLALGA